MPSEQHAAFLEGFANGGDAEGEGGWIERQSNVQVCGKQAVRFLDAAAGKHQRAAGKIDLVMAHHHEHFQAVGSVAQ
jgi:hypothetical protein